MSRQDRVAYKFGDLRDYGVSASSKAVCPIGNPISHSLRTGLIHPSTRYGTHLGSHFRSKPILRPLGRVSPRDFRCIVSIENGAKPLLLLGVGHKPNPVAQVWSTDSGRRYAVPFRVIPDLGQVSENSTEPSSGSFAGASKKTSDVLHKEEPGLYLANETNHFGPESASRTFKPGTTTSDGKVLAREATGNDIDCDSIGSEPSCSEGSHIVIDRHLGPVFRKDAAREFLNLAERDGLEPARALQAKAEATDAAEQIEKLELRHLPPPPQSRARAMTGAMLAPEGPVAVGMRREGGLGIDVRAAHALALSGATGKAGSTIGHQSVASGWSTALPSATTSSCHHQYPAVLR